MKFPTKIPTLVGMLLLIFVVGFLVYTTEKIFRTASLASQSQQPTDVRMTNIAHSMFTVSWTTTQATTGTLVVSSQGKSDTVYFDDRDTSGKLGTYTTHSVTVHDGKASTRYTFKILSNGKPYLSDEKPYSLTLPDALSINTGGLDPAYGTVHKDNGMPAESALVYLTLDGGQDLSTLTKPSGNWLIPLNQARTQDLTAFLPTVERMTESITVNADELTTTAISDSLNDSPVPDMTLGKTYDFRKQQAKTTNNAPLALRPIPKTPTVVITDTPAPIAVAFPTTTGKVLGVTTTPQIYTVTITAPKNGAAIPTTLPLIQGTGVPGKFIGLRLGLVNPIHSSVKVATNGLWTFTPPKPLAPGKQTVTVTSVDSVGKTIAVTHAFEILKSGTQVLGDATPSATLTPGFTITPTATLALTPTSTQSATPTEEPTITIVGDPPPTSGYQGPLVLLLVFAVALLGFGAFALF